MADRTRMLRAAVLAAPLGALALGAQAADIASTIKEQQQFSTLAEAMEAAGLAESLQGEGPYTIFAPTDQAFDRLPQGVQDALMQGENREQLKRLLQYHVIEGEEIMAGDVLGKQSYVATVSGDRLSVDGTGDMILLVPDREAQGQQTEVAEESGMPASDHQQQVLAQKPATEQRQTGAQDSDMPSSPHQEQVLRGVPATEQQTGTEQPQTAQRGDVQTEVAEESGMPTSEHQQQVLAEEPATEERQTAQEGDVPSSPHQEQVLRSEQGAEQQGQQATVVEQDIKADNGVIHAIDTLLVPQSVLSTLEEAGTSPEGETGSTWRTGDEQR